jgi:DNA (cytosine-5)-methyltransferase 1
MRFIELFAGIGGFRLGLERQGHECVWTNEWLEKPASIYKKNFKDEPNTEDIRTIDPISIPDHELIVGGFPCATFSIAGKRSGLSEVDTRGTLFFEICRIASSRKTPYILLENVKGLLNHDDGRTFAVILLSLDRLGYDIQWQLLNSKDFGVPQNRERVFIFASLRGKYRPKVFPINRFEIGDIYGKSRPSRMLGLLVKKTSKRIINDKLEIIRFLKDNRKNFTTKQISDTINVPLTTVAHWFRTDSSGTLPNKEEWVLLKNLLQFDDRYDFEICDSTIEYNVEFESTRRVYEKDGCMPTLTASNVPIIKDGKLYRYLTPLECERLQGLPDNWTKWYHDGSIVPDNERYERIGRSVTINIIEEISKKLAIK